MASRQRGKTAEPKQQQFSQPSDQDNNNSSAVAQGWPASARPLSDIRELTEPSLVESQIRKPSATLDNSLALHTHVKRQSSLKRGPSLRRAASVTIVEPRAGSRYRYDADESGISGDSPASFRDGSSMYSIPISSVPVRASSQSREATKTLRSSSSTPSFTASRQFRSTVPNRGKSCSPVKQAALRQDPVSSQNSRRIPSRTFIRTPQPRDILDFPTHRHPRISLAIQIAAPLFVGGGSLEGTVRVVIDEAERTRHKKDISVGRLAVDLVGVEETSSFRKSIFLALGTELLDANHAPPRNMLNRINRHQEMDGFWTVMPSYTNLPFILSLPLDTGPPPFHSKQARIRFILCATLLVKESDRQYLVRCSEAVSVLSTYDPEKALRSLPSPLTASDEHISTRSGTVESIKVTAGLHRQVWVSGSTIFVDVHIANSSRKTIKKLELSLERDILCYRHAAAATLEQSASQARIFESNDRSILSKSCLKQGAHAWTGVEAYGSATRTCDIDMPRGHATVKCGKYFEVRYFLNVAISTAHTRIVSVQLPIILIHMNSLDVLPNSVAQVAAAIDEKRSRHDRGRSHTASEHNVGHSITDIVPRTASLTRRPSKLQGRAFAAPRQQSLERSRADAVEIHQLGAALDASPRKHIASKTSHVKAGRSQGSIKLHKVAGNATIVSRPAREIHKQPSNLSLGGISVGSYTIFNDSSFSNAGMEYVTPPSRRKGRIFDMDPREIPNHGDGDHEEHDHEEEDNARAIRGRQSFESSRSHKSTTAGKSRWRPLFGMAKKDHASAQRQVYSAMSHRPQTNSIGAHTLGLTRHVGGIHEPQKQVMQSHVVERPSRDGAVSVARALSWRTKDDVGLDRSRFEFKAVKKKESGAFKDWLGGLRPGKQDRAQGRNNWL